MKQTIMWLALALLFAIGITLSITADSYGPSATAETTGPATLVEAPQPVVAANAKPAEPEVPVAMLDDVPPKPTIGSEALARWFVEPGASPATRAAEAPVAPLPLAPATTATLPANPGKTPKRASSRWKVTLGQPESPKTATRNCPASGERPTPGHADRQADFRIYCDD